MEIHIYNSLSKKIEVFEPLEPNQVSIYLCGPTVYDFVSIGNFRTYLFGDFVRRAFELFGYKTNYVMNLTDVGHLTGDNLGDADVGDDRLEKSAEKEGKSAKEIADYYIKDFMTGYEKFNMKKPQKFTRATDYIKEQIDLVRELESKGFTYKIDDGIYFDTSKFPEYGQLSGLTKENILEGARVEPNPLKKNPNDFALWKFSPRDKVRWQEWESPWGIGFPGWHIECSAMSMKELGETIDLHLGGEDLRMIHHQNEIAQSECATGKSFVKYWMHGAFLLVNNGRMGKSLGNSYTLSDIEDKGYDPLSLRYFYMSAHYRSKLNFTWEALANAQNSYKKLLEIVSGLEEDEKAQVDQNLWDKFTKCLSEDINVPKALAVLWDVVKADIDESSKVKTLLEMDKFFGLKLEDHIGFQVPDSVLNLARMRQQYRKSGIYDKADTLRREVESLGFVIEDTGDSYKVKRLI